MHGATLAAAVHMLFFHYSPNTRKSVSLRYALLALLIDGEATGYELSKAFDRSVANFWHALPQQLYAELAAMERDGLVEGEVVVQQTRPNKRLFSMTSAGRAALVDWFEEPARMASTKDDLLIRSYAVDLADAPRMIELLQQRLAQREEKLAGYEAIRETLLRGRSEDEFVRGTRRFGPYLALKSGILYERSSIEWTRWAIDAIRERAAARGDQPKRRRSTAGV
jgi:DNA-binding PadR family transcriptional regulator